MDERIAVKGKGAG